LKLDERSAKSRRSSTKTREGFLEGLPKIGIDGAYSSSILFKLPAKWGFPAPLPNVGIVNLSFKGEILTTTILLMGNLPKITFQCDECGNHFEVTPDKLLIPKEGLEFHVGVTKCRHPANYCRVCLADKLRLLADEILETWPDYVLG